MAETAKPRPYSFAQGFDEVAQAVLAVLDEVGIATCTLVGYSMGGRLALYLALTNPERFDRALIESASPGLETEAERAARRAHDERLAGELEAQPLEAFLRRWYAQPLFASVQHPPERHEALIRRRLSNDPAGLALSLREMGLGSQPSLWDKLSGVRIPLRLVVGERDAKFRQIARRICAVNPQIELCTVPDCGHNVHFERPEEYTRAVEDFLRFRG